MFTLGRGAGHGHASEHRRLRSSGRCPPIAGILLIVAAGGGFKQMLIDTGIGDVIANGVSGSGISVLLLGWLVAVLIRLATGSATVATVTASGILAPLVATLEPADDVAAGAGDRRRLAVLLPRQRRRLLAGQGVLRAHRRPDHQDLVGDGDDASRWSAWCSSCCSASSSDPSRTRPCGDGGAPRRRIVAFDGEGHPG